MDPVRLSVWVLMICLNRITRESGNENCLCSKIPQRPFTKRPEETCIGTASRFRYVCNDTFVRQAGTSNLIKCLKGSKWSNNLNLICIPDPKIPTSSSAKPDITTQAPKSFKTSTGFQNEETSESPDRGPNKTQTAPGTMRQITVQCCTSQSATHSTVATNRTIDAHKGTVTSSLATNLSISLAVVILICAAISIILIYRRRINRIPPSSVMEIKPMNVP
ncbi:interleukin-15 receptor subunit alpha isoform X1 [Kryptolebias marmoratus]|uniref:interleukin-15 receptor subunit alpha isoform X1 n=1 Tax=Kryptolebias marmoratus TaxID=37003 RepID=UPI0007F8F8F7|nr:interleukin-15 receptor subunit alpha isoform X1 [Kryptolebias marmoratus]